MKKNWIVEQTKYNVSQWDKSMEDIDSNAVQWNKESTSYYNRVCKECNFFDASKMIQWDKYILDNSEILDLGCGGGWLSAYLSRYERVDRILAVDTSKNYLFNIMPGVIDIVKGNANKIIPTEGMFSPLLIEKKSLDIVVASAAVHHADNLESLLIEIHSKLKKGGYLILLNETPQGYLRYISRIILAFSKILIKTMFKKYETISPKISNSGFEYDSYLGDKSYPMWYWKKALSNAEFELTEVVNTTLPTVKNMSKGKLVHFICKAK